MADHSIQHVENKVTLLTKDGLQKLIEELEYLENVKRREVANRLKEAVSYGDLSENSEYEDAKNEQAQLERKVLTLTEQVKYAKVIDEDNHHGSSKNMTLQLGMTVKIKCVSGKDSGQTYEYTIVGTTEADPFNHKISNESPLGTALLDHKAGDVVESKAPAGLVKFEILKIQ